MLKLWSATKNLNTSQSQPTPGICPLPLLDVIGLVTLRVHANANPDTDQRNNRMQFMETKDTRDIEKLQPEPGYVVLV
jgi:hypothetical protein